MAPTADNSPLATPRPKFSDYPIPETEPATAKLDPWADPATVAVTKNGQVIAQIDEDELDADVILKYQAMAAKAFKQGKGGDREILTPQFVTASHWLMMQLFTVDGQPLTIDHLTGKPSTNPKCLGLMAIAQMNKVANDLITEIPSGKGS